MSDPKTLDNQSLESSLKLLAEALIALDERIKNKVGSLSERLSWLSLKIGELEEKWDLEAKIQKSRYNAFDCLTRHHLEELHSKFIYSLLNPKGTHDCGTFFLKLFFEELQGIDKIPSSLFELSEEELTKANVQIELSINSNNLKTYGRIDIHISVGEFSIAVENKLNASEQHMQLDRYYDYCGAKGIPLVLFLTPTGHTSIQTKEDKYVCISYEKHILNWLNNCLEQEMISSHYLIRSGIEFYKDLVEKKLLDKQLNINQMEEIKKLILSEEGKPFLNYRQEIVDTLNEIYHEARGTFLTESFKILSRRRTVDYIDRKRGYIEKIAVNEIWDYNNKYRGLLIREPSLTYIISARKSIHFCIEHNCDVLYYGLVGVSNNSTFFDCSSASSFHEILKSMENKIQGTFEKPDKEFSVWQYFSFGENANADFSDEKINCELIHQRSEVIGRFTTKIEKFLFAWEETIRELAP